jgi:hypothetical protein
MGELLASFRNDEAALSAASRRVRGGGASSAHLPVSFLDFHNVEETACD